MEDSRTPRQVERDTARVAAENKRAIGVAIGAMLKVRPEDRSVSLRQALACLRRASV